MASSTPHPQRVQPTDLVLSAVDTQEKEQLREEEGDRYVGVDATCVGLEAFEAGQKGEGQQQRHQGERHQGIGDNCQCLQITFQLLQQQRTKGK